MLAAVDFSRGVEDAWSSTASFVPKFLGFLVVLVVGYFIAKAIGTIVDKLLERAGFDRAVTRGGIRQALATSKYDASEIVSKLVFSTLFLFVLQLAFGIFGANPVSALLTSLVAFLPKLVAAILIVVVASAIAAAVKDIVGNALSGLSSGKTLANVASISILAIGVFMALNQVEIARPIVNGLFYAVLAALVGITIVAVGGGGIQPMRARWERALAKVDEEATNMKRHLDLTAQERSTEAATVTGDSTQPIVAGGVASTPAEASPSSPLILPPQ